MSRVKKEIKNEWQKKVEPFRSCWQIFLVVGWLVGGWCGFEIRIFVEDPLREAMRTEAIFSLKVHLLATVLSVSVQKEKWGKF